MAAKLGAQKKTAKKSKRKNTPATAKKPVVVQKLARRKPKTGKFDSHVADLQLRIHKLESLLDVSKALTATRDLDTLLKIIVNEAIEVVGADRMTLWVVDRDTNEIWTKVAKGLEAHVLRIPVALGIAGKVAQTGELINIPDAYADERFNRQVDKDTGYKTRNILAVPMRYTTGEVTGVLQALNKANDTAFTKEDEELLMALGSSAAGAIENAILNSEIDELFEGFVKASVTAIESRDPTTSGHSERVALLTLGIAENVQRLSVGPYAGVTFSHEDMREIRYAALLHDFGKVGVRENVLIKSHKLYPGELEIIETRFRALQAQRENALLKQIIQAMRAGNSVSAEDEGAVQSELLRLEAFLDFVKKCNQPTVLESGGFEKLKEIAELSFIDARGERSPLLAPRELQRLSIPRGTLDQGERLEIESHVEHTYRFLTQIPWTRNLRRIPDIAYAHHEKLDGVGYPRQLDEAGIPVQSKMMTIADIYDALTASDRPYKRAVPHEKALDILKDESSRGKIDSILLDVFIDAQVHKRVLPA